MQSALIDHCELMRYRFAVLDGRAAAATTRIADVQAQRQQFDTKYAALYHPWLLDPRPVSRSTPADAAGLPDPARRATCSASTRAPTSSAACTRRRRTRWCAASSGCSALLNKEQHDILNPYPVNINVIRDFRPNNRGIRVYGGRVITSDSDWKYVNVRRLLIFIEASIDRGLQWVVFEPNAEPLWARVRRSISELPHAGLAQRRARGHEASRRRSSSSATAPR